MATPQQQQTNAKAEAARKKQVTRDSAKTQRDRALLRLPLELRPKKTGNGIEGGDTGAWTALDNHIEALSTRNQELEEDLDAALWMMTPEMREVFDYYRGKKELERRLEKQKERERVEAEVKEHSKGAAEQPQATVFRIWSQTEEDRPKRKGRPKKVTSTTEGPSSEAAGMHPRDTAPEPLSQQEERGPTPGPSNSASGFELFRDVDRTTWTDEAFLASTFAPDTASIVSAPAEGLFSSYSPPYPQHGRPSMPSPPQEQTYLLPDASFVHAPAFDQVPEFASTSMHNYSNISRAQLEFDWGSLDTAGDPLPTAPKGHSHQTTKLHYWSSPSSSSRQIGNTQADSDESPRKTQKRKHEDIENREEKYRSQYRRTFEN